MSNGIIKKVAIVTGASQGIGLAIARELALLDYQVCLLSRSKKRLEKAAQEILDDINPKYPPKIYPIDLKNTENTRKFSNNDF